jgi:hypothetical protein
MGIVLFGFTAEMPTPHDITGLIQEFLGLSCIFLYHEISDD